MPILNFQKQFADKVKNGTKRQTIRKLRKHPIKIDDILYLYTGLRTKNCEKIGQNICNNVEYIEILHDGFWILSDKILNDKELELLAEKDGFKDFDEMCKWFSKNHDLPFKGQVIQW